MSVVSPYTVRDRIARAIAEYATAYVSQLYLMFFDSDEDPMDEADGRRDYLEEQLALQITDFLDELTSHGKPFAYAYVSNECIAFSEEKWTAEQMQDAPGEWVDEICLYRHFNDEEWRSAIVEALKEQGLFAAEDSEDPALAVRTLQTIAAMQAEEQTVQHLKLLVDDFTAAIAFGPEYPKEGKKVRTCLFCDAESSADEPLNHYGKCSVGEAEKFLAERKEMK